MPAHVSGAVTALSDVSLPPFPAHGGASFRVNDEEPSRTFPTAFWEKSVARIKRPFGTAGEMLTLSQAIRRRLVVWNPVYRVNVLACSSKEEEDRKLRAFARARNRVSGPGEAAP